MPSSPIAQAWWKTNSPGCARCSLRRKPGRHPRRALSIRKPGSPTCSPASTITTSRSSTRCCPGAGKPLPPSSRPDSCSRSSPCGHAAVFTGWIPPKPMQSTSGGVAPSSFAAPAAKAAIDRILGKKRDRFLRGAHLVRAAPTSICGVDGCAERPRCNVDAAPEAHTLHRQWLTKG